MLTKEPEERLGMHIKGGMNGQKGNPYDNADEGVFVSKINSTGAARRDGRLKVGQRLLEVNGVSLLGASHQEAVDCLRAAGNSLYLVVCKGYDKSGPVNPLNVSNAAKVDANGDEHADTVNNNVTNKRFNARGASETGSEFSHSMSSLDRDDDAFVAPSKSVATVPEERVREVVSPVHEERTNQEMMESVTTSSGSELVPLETDNALVAMKEKSTPEKVSDGSNLYTWLCFKDFVF